MDLQENYLLTTPCLFLGPSGDKTKLKSHLLLRFAPAPEIPFALEINKVGRCFALVCPAFCAIRVATSLHLY